MKTIRLMAPNPIFPVIIDIETGEIFPIEAPKLPLVPHFKYYVYDWDGTYMVTTDILVPPRYHYHGCFITDKEGHLIRVR